MADKKLSQLPASALPIAGTDLLYVARDTGGGGYSSIKATVDEVLAAPFDTLIVAGEVAIGNRAHLGEAVYSPDQLTDYTPHIFPVSIQHFHSTDFSQFGLFTVGGVKIYNGYSNTNANPSTSFVFDVDIEPALNSTSTAVTRMYAVGAYPVNYSAAHVGIFVGVEGYPILVGSGETFSVYGVSGGAATFDGEFTGVIDEFEGLICELNIANTGTINNATGLHVYHPIGTPAKAINTTGILIEDHTGWGAATSYNLLSKGINSRNRFEGNVDIDGDLVIGNFGTFNSITWKPGDPTGIPADTFTSNTALVVNDLLSGDLSVFGGKGSMALYTGFRHTGAGGMPIIAVDIEPTLNSDSTGPVFTFVGLGVYPTNFSPFPVTWFNATDTEAFVSHPAGTTVQSAVGLYAAANWYDSYRGHTVGYRALEAECMLPEHGTIGICGTATFYRPFKAGSSPVVIPDQVLGVVIGDHTGYGSPIERNLWSQGLLSENLFEGTVKVSRGVGVGNDVDLNRNLIGVDVTQTFAGIANLTGNMIGVQSIVSHNDNSFVLGEVTGLTAHALLAFPGSQCLELNGIRARVQFNASSTVPISRTIFAGRPLGSGSGAAANVYGIQIDDHSGLSVGDSLNIFSKGVQSGNSFEGAIRSVPRTFANRPTPATQGMFASFTDSTVNTFGATIAGGGANKVLGHFNGTNWTVMAV